MIFLHSRKEEKMNQLISKYIIKNYFIRRLAPFYLMTLVVFGAQSVYMLSRVPVSDWSFYLFLGLIVNVLGRGSLFFIPMGFVLILYLVGLPPQKQNGLVDRFTTLFLFFVFTFLTGFEKISEVVFWEINSVDNILFFSDYAWIGNESADPHLASEIFFQIGCLVFLVSLGALLLVKKTLFPNVKAPVLKRRFFIFCIFLVFVYGILSWI